MPRCISSAGLVLSPVGIYLAAAGCLRRGVARTPSHGRLLIKCALSSPVLSRFSDALPFPPPAHESLLRVSGRKGKEGDNPQAGSLFPWAHCKGNKGVKFSRSGTAEAPSFTFRGKTGCIGVCSKAVSQPAGEGIGCNWRAPNGRKKPTLICAAAKPWCRSCSDFVDLVVFSG